MFKDLKLQNLPVFSCGVIWLNSAQVVQRDTPAAYQLKLNGNLKRKHQKITVENQASS